MGKTILMPKISKEEYDQVADDRAKAKPKKSTTSYKVKKRAKLEEPVKEEPKSRINLLGTRRAVTDEANKRKRNSYR
jgi:hypothetical protein